VIAYKLARTPSYVICFVYDQATDSSECHIIDAKRFTDEPVTRIKIPQRVPNGFHAAWAPASIPALTSAVQT
jgi:carotenoid cleavage dioxygenase-like enzyme